MKTNNMIRGNIKTLMAFGFVCIGFSLFAQDGAKKDIHTEKRTVIGNRKDSTLTIIKEDRENGNDVKRTIVIRDGDTITNIIISKNSDNNSGKESSIIVDGDSIVKIEKGQGNKNSINQRKVIILNGDSIITLNPEDADVNIVVDTACIRNKMLVEKSLQGSDKKGIFISDKYIVINMKKLSHRDTIKKKLKAGVIKVGLEGFDLGFTQFVDHGHYGVNQENALLGIYPYKSVNVNFRVMDLRVNLLKHRLFLDVGLEFDLHDYGFTNNVTIKQNSNQFAVYKDSTANFSRDKLSTQYLELPLMLCFQTNPRHPNPGFQIGIGGYIGTMLGAYTKQVSGEHGLQRYFGDLYTNPIDYGFMAEIGELKGSQLFVKYNMSSVFDVSRGAPDIGTVTVGLRFFHPWSW